VSNPHAPTTLDNYIHVHDSHMARFEMMGRVIRNECAFTFLAHETRLDGVIYLSGRLKLEVAKTLTHLDGSGWRVHVRTCYFSYHALREPNRNIFRYDSRGDHRPHAHRHEYDTFGTGEEVSLVYLKTPQEIPSLKRVIEELHHWGEIHRSQWGSVHSDGRLGLQ
jgi:hypothetical protein